MKQALEVAGLDASDVGYINAHGTATPNNDFAEGQALLRIYGSAETIPLFSTTKAFTGHTLAAAGAIEAVFSLLALKYSEFSLKLEMHRCDLNFLMRITTAVCGLKKKEYTKT